MSQLALIDLSAPHHQAKQGVILDRDMTDIVAAMQISSKTSIARRSESAPLKVLIKKGLINSSHSRVLNYGKGKYEHERDFDSQALSRLTNSTCHSYDYTFAYNVTLLMPNAYDLIYCAYVANVLPPKARQSIYSEMSQCLSKNKGASCFIAARSDKDRGLQTLKGTPFEDGIITSIKTFQKFYSLKELESEALVYFPYVRYIAKGAFHLIECSHQPFN